MAEGLGIVLVVWNVITFAVMYLDKRSARLGRWRIAEARLLFLGLMMGAPGLWFGMKLFRHKTQHAKFAYGIPVLWIINCACVLGGYYLVMRFPI